MDNSARKAVGTPSNDTLDPVKSGTMATHKVIDAPFIKGEKIAGRYVVDRVLAEGGMGIVLAARHLELDEMVAIKFLKPEFARQQDIIGRFAREAKAAARIKSEYIAAVTDVGVIHDRGPYIVMEYLEGEDLEHVISTEGKFPVERGIELILQACEALASAHANGIIHRDIKPENLFLVKREKGLPIIKVLDFGVSKTALTGNVFGGQINVAKTQSLLGSPLYMSPEQLRGKIDVDFTADIWSLGAVIYELLSGRPPFNGSTVTEVCSSVLETVPRDIPELAPDVPPELSAVVMKCLDKDPTNRFQSVAELAVALAPFGPKRSRMCVERAIAASKSANLIPASFQNPNSIPPPSGSLLDNPRAGRTALTESAPASARASEAEEQEVRPTSSAAKRAAIAAALFALGAGGMLGAKQMLTKPAPVSAPTVAVQPAAPAATQPATAQPATTQPATAAASTQGAQPTTHTADVAPGAAAMPAGRAGTALPNAGLRNGRPGVAGTPGALPRGTTSAAASAGQPQAVTSAPAPVVSAPATPTPTTNPTRSAIDDRK